MNHTTVFFIFCLLSLSWAVDLPPSSPPTLSSDTHSVISSLLSSQSAYVIDDVLVLIQQLLDEAQLQLDDLESEWELSSVEKSETVNNLTQIILDLQVTCKNYWENAAGYNDTMNTLKEKIQEYQDQIAKNKNRTETLHASRCTANQNYILGLTKNKNALALIEILREAVGQFSEESLIQLGVQRITKIASIISQLSRKNKKFKMLLQKTSDVPDVPDVSERTSEEIGTGHLDNTEDQITINNFDSETLESLQGIKTKLVNILDDLETSIRAEMKNNQANEMTSNEELADYEISLETENNYYISAIRNLTVQYNETIEYFNEAWTQVQDCQNQLSSWQDTLQAAETDLKNYTDYYNSKKEQFQDMIDLFTEIYNLYKNQVQSVSDEYKARADDYIDDQTFNTTDNFTKRTADEYNTLSGSLYNQTYDEAAQNVANNTNSTGLAELSEVEQMVLLGQQNDEAKSKEKVKKEVTGKAEDLREKIKNLNKLKTF